MRKDLAVVTEIAKEFLNKAGHPFPRLDKADPDQEAGKWRLTFMVGTYSNIRKVLTIDDETGKVISLE